VMSGRYRDLGAEHHVGSAEAEGPIKPFVGRAPGACVVIGLSQPTRLPAKNPTATTHSSRMATIDGKASTYSTTQNTTAAALPPAPAAQRRAAPPSAPPGMVW
jgi:hypothetical protein